MLTYVLDSYRMDRDSFWELHDLIKDDPIFQGAPGRPQRRPHIQLATFLCRLGGETGLKTAGFAGIAEGSVNNYMKRVTHALRRLRNTFVRWPSGENCEVVLAYFEDEDFPGCLGSGDGSYFRSGVKPLRNGFAFFCHKGFYAVRVFVAQY